MKTPKKLVIFGTATTAENAFYYFTNDSDYKPVAFCANSEYVTKDNFMDLPLFPFNEIKEKFPPNEYSFFCAVGQRDLNSIRKDIYFKAREMGYPLASYISSKADIADNVKIGEHCYISDIRINPYSIIGNNCYILSVISHHTVLEDHCYIVGGVTMWGKVKIGEQTFIALNSTIRDNITIGERCIIGAGSLIMHDTGSDKVFLCKETKAQKMSSEVFSKGLLRKSGDK
jgi:sugar O-acyltransferase (sialic acid O-acetyltransferase NeuD family)